MDGSTRQTVTIVVVRREQYELDRMTAAIAGEHIEVHGATDLKTGLELIELHHPRILIIDLTDGAARKLMEAGRAAVPKVEILIVFGKSDTQELAAVVDAGPAEYLRLPVDETRLQEAVTGCLERLSKARTQDNSVRRLLDFFPTPALLAEGGHVTYLNRSLSRFLGQDTGGPDTDGLDTGFEDFITRLNGDPYDGRPSNWIAAIMDDPLDRDHVMHVENPRNPEGRATVFSVNYNTFPGSDMLLFIFQDISGLEDEKAGLEDQATTDPMTRALNRRGFLAKLDEVLASERGFGLIMFDIDHFKSINDTYGHDVGDSVLKEITQLVRTNIRTQDVLGRWGGEEFMVLSPGAGPKLCARVAERLRELVAGFQFSDVPRQVTSSFGVVIRGVGEGSETLLKRADLALYKAKETGRNKVVKG